MSATKAEKVVEFVRERGVVRSRDIEGIGVSREYLRRLVANGEVEVPGRAVRDLAPRGEQHRALEQKAVSVLRAAESVEEALQAEAGKGELEHLVSLVGEVEQLLADGRREVLDLARTHVSDSR